MTIHHSKTTPPDRISRPKATGSVNGTTGDLSAATVSDQALAVPNGRSRRAGQAPESRLEAIANPMRKVLSDEFPGARFADLAVHLDPEGVEREFFGILRVAVPGYTGMKDEGGEETFSRFYRTIGSKMRVDDRHLVSGLLMPEDDPRIRG